MTSFLGIEVGDVGLTSIVSNTWVWVLLVFVIFVICIISIVALLHFKTWNKKVRFFENIGGRGYQQIGFKRARLIKVGSGGTEVLKPKGFTGYLSAYGQKMGKNEFWYAKGQDGFWYNVVLGDLDGKMNMLDIEPIDRDVRMFHIAMDRITQTQFGEKKSFGEKYGGYVFLFGLMIIFFIGMYVIMGRIADISGSNQQLAETNVKTSELIVQALGKVNNIQTTGSGTLPSGLVPATNLTG